MKSTGLPVWAGGLQDQPHIWLEMIGVIEAVQTVFDNIARANQPEKK